MSFKRIVWFLTGVYLDKLEELQKAEILLSNC